MAALAAIYAPFPKDIQALMPVLRSNFWLGIHVLTITTSYAGAARGLGDREYGLGISSPLDAIARWTGKRRPPAFCGTLASLNYRVLQVTVLLLAAGTILGGLWADVSWGRFWGWDPKEVGALIALLVIMTALHGRRAGWHGDLSLAIGSILGFWRRDLGLVCRQFHSQCRAALLWRRRRRSMDLACRRWRAIQLLFMAVAVARVMIETGQPATAAS